MCGVKARHINRGFSPGIIAWKRKKANATDATDAKVRYGIRGEPFASSASFAFAFRSERTFHPRSAQPVDDWYIVEPLALRVVEGVGDGRERFGRWTIPTAKML